MIRASYSLKDKRKRVIFIKYEYSYIKIINYSHFCCAHNLTRLGYSHKRTSNTYAYPAHTNIRARSRECSWTQTLNNVQAFRNTYVLCLCVCMCFSDLRNDYLSFVKEKIEGNNHFNYLSGILINVKSEYIQMLVTLF